MTNGTEAFDRMHFVLGEIARGRCDNGRPLAAETARQMARNALSVAGLEWPQRDRGANGERGNDA